MQIRRFLVVLILFFCTVLSAEKDWILLEKGKKLFREGEFGKAMTVFKQAQVEYPGLPEADWWIGKIFMVEGNYELAKAQLLKAYNNRKLLYIPSEQYEIMYQLSEIYFYSKKDTDYLQQLEEITADHNLFALPQLSPQVLAMEGVLSSQGLDRLLTLYRDESDFAALAHLRLGVFYTQTARYSKGLTHLMMFNIIVLTKAIKYRLEIDPEFEFTSLDALFTAPFGNEIKEYLYGYSWSESLYYLSLAMIGTGKKAGALKILPVLVKYPENDSWKKKALSLQNDPKLIPITEKTMPVF
jgi:tetratricopeptide (TPR) repeat protein